jgi:hypothetical protein
MTGRTERAACYVSPELLETWQKEADKADQSLSEWMYRQIEQQRRSKNQDELIRETAAEERIESLIAEGRDSLLSIGQDISERNNDMADLQARSGCYAIVNFLLLKRLFKADPDLSAVPESWIDDTFSAASQKLRADTDQESGTFDPQGQTDNEPGRSDDSEERESEGNIFDELRSDRP